MTDITTPEPSNTEATDNAFAAPEANLTNTSLEKPVLEFKRFSAWWVFLLGLITQNLYQLYWMYDRGNKANALSTHVKSKMIYLFIAIPLVSIGTILSFIIEDINTTAVLAYNLLIVVGAIFWIMYAFSLRRVLEEIISEGQEEPTYLNGFMTFFFNAIYFQYKINEAIDNQKTEE